MRYATGSNTEPGLTALLDAAQNEPVFIRQGETDVAVLVSVREYDRLSNAANDQFQAFCDSIAGQAQASGLTDDKLHVLLHNA